MYLKKSHDTQKTDAWMHKIKRKMKQSNLWFSFDYDEKKKL